MLSTFLTRMKANQCWTSQAIVALLSQATNIQLPEATHKQLMETIQSLQCATGSHVKLANAGQHVQALAPYLSQTDWTKLGELQTLEDRLQVLALRLSKMGMANLKEATIEQALAIILMTDHWHGRPIMTPQAVHSRVKDSGPFSIRSQSPAPREWQATLWILMPWATLGSSRPILQRTHQHARKLSWRHGSRRRAHAWQ